MPVRKAILASILICILFSCEREEADRPLTLQGIFIGDTEISLGATMTTGVPTDRSITLVFSAPVSETAADNNAIVLSVANGDAVQAGLSFQPEYNSVVIFPAGTLNSNTTYTLTLTDDLRGTKGELFVQQQISFKTAAAPLEIVSIKFGGIDPGTASRITDVPLDLSMTIEFSLPVNEGSLATAARLSGSGASALTFSLSENNRTLDIKTSLPLRDLSKYQFTLSTALTGSQGETFSGFSRAIYTTVNPTPDFPPLSDEELLNQVQQQTFKYFWDFAHPNSGMARERNTSGDIVTSGGSGFGIMTLLVGMERNFITRSQGLERIEKILAFLETADRFHGAWPHWLDGNTGKVVPFSANDNGGDLVETSFLVQGLLTFREYLDENIAAEKAMIDRINALWQAVEWDWYTRGGEKILYWHWSPDKQWIMNHAIRGYNEALITYVLAASSPTHAVDAPVYHEGWADNGAIRNNKSFYNIPLPLGYDYGGPLFFAHYSFLGLDPRSLQDTYGNYWTQNVNHTLINQAYCVANPKNFVGYSDANWGLTASDNHQGYSAHSPTNDLGVITPTAALSSFPYTPEESMKALKFFYYSVGDRLWGNYGFYDAFNLTEGWTASSCLAIDQGPIVIMIENHRTGLLWDLFMSAPEVNDGLNKLGFTH
jgi:hypothetical protein